MTEHITQDVTVKELKEMFKSGDFEIEIDTPDGFQPVVDWFDKGVLNMVQVKTESFTTDCAVNHLIQLADEKWVPAEHIVIGDKVITKKGIEEVLSIATLEPAECFDFTVDHDI